MTEKDMLQRGVNWGQIQHWYRSRGIHTAINEQTCDDYEEQYARDLFRSAVTLNELRNVQNHKVFVNCTAGVSRGPTLMLVYLALFIRHEKWEDIEALYEFVEFHYRWQDANMEIAKHVVEHHKDFQLQQYQLWLEEQERKKREQEAKGEREPIDDEAERLRLLRLLEIEQEKLRVQRQ
jgi:hypothetical protein